MPYVVEIPNELKSTIEKYIDNSYKNLNWQPQELDFLLTVFYRYVQKLDRRNYKSVEDKVKAKKNCAGCRSIMRDYFNKAVESWHEQKNGDTWQL